MIDKETKEKEPKDLLQAVQEVSDYNAALKFLNQECHVCLVEYTANEMIQMFFCNHMFCRACVKLHFEHVVRNAAIKKWTCPECGEPDIQQMEDPSEYFGLLSTVVQALCEHDVTDLYHQKLNEFAISKRPEFRYSLQKNIIVLKIFESNLSEVIKVPIDNLTLLFKLIAKWDMLMPDSI